ncbi:MAG: hypothetical protein DMD79_09370 [Candidatus Rokuibacteriota bacterium]|nr:MAG: hypothetical protein DMD79_09370 [Candidatus Rokubacteria bacterium]
MPDADDYRIPEVFVQAHARGFAGLPLAENPDTLTDPETGRPVAPADYSHSTILKRRAPGANKQADPAEIGEWKARAERVLGSRRYSVPAVIGGMPVVLQTNSIHAKNFWSRNWFLTDGAAVEDAVRNHGVPVVRMWCAIAERDPGSAGAYYCGETNECVFWNTDYYGQMKSWALGAAGVELARHDIHSIHGAVVDVGGRGVLIVAPTGTGKSTYTQFLSHVEDLEPTIRGQINSDDWVYVKDGVATPSERHIYVRTNAVRDDLDEAAMPNDMRALKRLFDRHPAENVPVRSGRRFYGEVPNSRCMIDPAGLAGVTYATKIDLVVLLRRDPHSPFERLLTTDEALAVLEEGEFTVQPGAGPQEDWGKLSNEPWYNPYLLRPDREFERRMFASYQEKHGARYVIYNTGAAVCAREFGIRKPVEALTPEDYRTFIEKTARRMLERLDEVRPAQPSPR